MSGLTDQVANLNKRVGALESTGLDENAGIARIQKVYGNVKVSMRVSVKLHTFKKCSSNLRCSENLII